MVEQHASNDTIQIYMCIYVQVILHKVVHAIHLNSIKQVIEIHIEGVKKIG